MSSEEHHESSSSSVAVPVEEQEQEMYKGLDHDDTEVLDSNTKSLLMSMMGELKIGMDLTKVAIPCDFLEPRSLLEKLTDFLSHCQILCEAPDHDDPVDRMLEIVRAYTSGWHVKPKGVKKPYNPILVCRLLFWTRGFFEFFLISKSFLVNKFFFVLMFTDTDMNNKLGRSLPL